jgi:diketogulonate reductase-like aldo/keto reductase
MTDSNKISRKKFLQQAGLASASVLLNHAGFAMPAAENILLKKIPSTGEMIPAIGLGSWITFDIGNAENERASLRKVLKAFVDAGGKLVDSSPMYGRSEKVIGELAHQLGITDKLWIATKVWTSGEEAGKSQIENSKNHFKKWPSLLQVHNLQDVKQHLKTLYKLKEQGHLKYIGITHYLNSHHSDLAAVIKTEKIDFVQVNVSIRNTDAEERLIPLAADKGVAVIINRPFETGALFNTVAGARLPAWAKDYGISTWAAYFLKYIISSRDITCTIPATSQELHLRQNMAALSGNIPDENARKKMIEYYKKVAA